MQIISNIALISINETVIVQVISFLIFLYIMNRIMFRPLRNVMADRENHIEMLQQDIDAAEKKFDILTDQIREQESAVKQEAFVQKDKLEEAGGKLADEIFAATRKEMAEVKAKAQKEVDDQVLEAKKYFKKEADSLALAVMEKILNRKVIK